MGDNRHIVFLIKVIYRNSCIRNFSFCTIVSLLRINRAFLHSNTNENREKTLTSRWKTAWGTLWYIYNNISIFLWHWLPCTKMFFILSRAKKMKMLTCSSMCRCLNLCWVYFCKFWIFPEFCKRLFFTCDDWNSNKELGKT